MLFTEPAFLFVFLPVLLAVYYLAPSGLRNLLLTLASGLFYALGELRFLPLLLGSVALNYLLALWIERTRHSPWGRAILALGIASDLILLIVFKYTGWLIENFNHVLSTLGLDPMPSVSILLPLGISFFTFHKISYKIDIYRGDTSAQRNPLTLALYILFFPQLIAGPIVRYHDIADQLARRSGSSEQFAEGIRRFVVGLAKKLIIADSVAVVADAAFQLPNDELSFMVAWLGVVCYTLQIYFDFSGYSDMAIGLALLFGFRFLENFDHPYAARSITEFWRCWHISLSRWFRDYLYIPLGGNRSTEIRTYANLLTVFFLCGLWHGASWEFVVWGLFHGSFLVIERLGFSRYLDQIPRVFTHAYVLLIVMVGWIFFRAGSLDKAFAFLAAMVGQGAESAPGYELDYYVTPWFMVTLVAGAVTAFPVRRWISDRLKRPGPGGVLELPIALELAALFGLFGLFLISLMITAAGTYSPFLYFRF